jgi:phosphatidylcholine synthase
MADPPAPADAPADTGSGAGPPAAFAWLVHMFTASGAMLALLALLAIERQQWRLALLFLLLALVVDGIDGTFARWARTKEKAARVDGDTLDLVVDYLTYVFVPTLFILKAGLVPQSLALWLAAAIQFSSLYLFARTDMKTQDSYFRGFPALWNLVAFYLFALGAPPMAGALVIVALAALTFAPVHFVHPLRVRDYGIWLPLLAAIWLASTCALLWLTGADPMRGPVLAASLVTAAILLLMGLARTFREGRRDPDAGGGAPRA